MSFDLQVINGDLVISSTGDLSIVQDSDKLKQDILKIILTPVGGNVLQPWYGSLVNKTLIGSILDPHITMSMAQQQLYSALQTLQKIQALQVSTGQSVSPAEQIASIQNIQITRNTVDPRLLTVLVSVLNKSFGITATSFTVSP